MAALALALRAFPLLAFLRRGAFGQLAVLFLFAEAPLFVLLTFLGQPLLDAPRLLFLAALSASAPFLRGFALRAFCLLVFLCRGALGQFAVFLRFSATALFVLLALLGFPLLSAARLSFLPAHRSNFAGWADIGLFLELTVARVAPIDGFVMYAVPSRFVHGSRLFLALCAFDAKGKQIDQRGLGRSW